MVLRIRGLILTWTCRTELFLSLVQFLLMRGRPLQPHTIEDRGKRGRRASGICLWS